MNPPTLHTVEPGSQKVKAYNTLRHWDGKEHCEYPLQGLKGILMTIWPWAKVKGFAVVIRKGMVMHETASVKIKMNAIKEKVVFFIKVLWLSEAYQVWQNCKFDWSIYKENIKEKDAIVYGLAAHYLYSNRCVCLF